MIWKITKLERAHQKGKFWAYKCTQLVTYAYAMDYRNAYSYGPF